MVDETANEVAGEYSLLLNKHFCCVQDANGGSRFGNRWAME